MRGNATLPWQLQLVEAERAVTASDDDGLAITLQNRARHTRSADGRRTPDLDSRVTREAERARERVIGADAASHLLSR